MSIFVNLGQNLAKIMAKVVNIGLVYRMKYNHQCGIITLKLLQQKKHFFPDINQNLDNVGPIFITLILLYCKEERIPASCQRRFPASTDPHRDLQRSSGHPIIYPTPFRHKCFWL